jgi:hypothetical protein
MAIMIAQRRLDVENIKDYKTLAQELCDIYEPASKTSLAEFIGISQKTIYNLIYGEPVGVYTKKKLGAFLLKEFGFNIKNLDKSKIKLVPSVNISGNIITNSNVSGRDLKVDQVSFLQNYITLLTDENNRLKLEIEKLRSE